MEKHCKETEDGSALIDAKMSNGRVVLFGFSPQFRARIDATFKFFFNCLLG